MEETKHCKHSVSCKVQVKILDYCPALFYAFLLQLILTLKHSLPLPPALCPKVEHSIATTAPLTPNTHTSETPLRPAPPEYSVTGLR